MKTLSIVLAATAIAATSSSFFATSAEAGRRGGGHRLHFHLQQMQMHQQRQAYRNDEEYSYRKKKKAAAAKVEKSVEKPVAVAKYIDGQGRQFDLTSKVWFDGKGQCFQGSQPFTFKNGGWSHGEARWIESSAGWGVTSGAAPTQVSCDGIKAFEAKLKPAEIKPIAKKVEPKVETVQKAEFQNNGPEPVTKTVNATESSARGECKKYFPSVGEMVTVPCS